MIDDEDDIEDSLWDEVYTGMEAANDIKFADYYGHKLLEAAVKGDIKLVKEIMSLPREKGGILLVRLTQKDESGNSALHLAVMGGNKEVIEYFVSGNNMDAKNNDGKTPLDIAEENGNKEILKVLKLKNDKQEI